MFSLAPLHTLRWKIIAAVKSRTISIFLTVVWQYFWTIWCGCFCEMSGHSGVGTEKRGCGRPSAEAGKGSQKSFPQLTQTTIKRCVKIGWQVGLLVWRTRKGVSPKSKSSAIFNVEFGIFSSHTHIVIPCSLEAILPTKPRYRTALPKRARETN